MGLQGGLLVRLRTTAVAVLYCVCFAAACNIDDMADDLITYTGDPGSYFGYTTVQHRNTQSQQVWILIGAPRGKSSFQPSVERPGALYKCQTLPSYNCFEIRLDNSNGNEDLPAEEIFDVKDNQWLGVSLTRQTNKGKNGDFAVCGHLWSNDYYIKENPDSEKLDRFPNGVCYVSNANFEQHLIKKLRPCVDERQVNGTYRYHGSCQAGISAAYTQSGDLILGAVGSYEWNGTTINAKKDGSTYRYNFGNLSDWNMLGQKGQTEFIGYSVSSGNFRSADTEQGVTGAPRSNSVGKVFIYNLDTFEVYTEFKGEQMGSYYGGTVLGVDLNNDGLSDLLVGAPLYSFKQDEGIVYVYINNKGEGKLELQGFKLEGSKAIGGRFGSTIAFIGDINLDDFNDVAIGAPYEDKNTGAVYIYRGYAGGIRRTYSQRIAARGILPGLLSFGSSISGGMDVDFNKYPDLVVGAYANDTVVLFKTLPIIKLTVWIEVEPETLDPEFPNCNLGGQPITCLAVQACFHYTAEYGLPNDVKFDYNLEVDTLKTDIGATPRFFFLTDEGNETTALANTVELNTNEISCYPTNAYLRSEVRDFLTPLKFLLNYNIFNYPPPTCRMDICKDDKFPGGLVPVLDDSICSNGTAEKMVLFVRDCGSDSICQTNIKVLADLEVQSGNPYITLGGDSVVYLSVEVQNQGEEAHNTELLITHPREVVYESLEMQMVGCIESSSCTPDNTVTCRPREAYNGTTELLCSVGNPMRSNSTSILRMRFDVRGVALGRQVVDFSLTASTISVEEGADSLLDNTVTVKLPVRIVADIVVRGVVQPGQILYSPDKEAKDGKAPDKEALLRQALIGAGFLDGDGMSNMKGIGPTFTHVYEVGNRGPGRLPFDGVVTIELPWRAINGDWLIYIKNIQMNGKGTCDSSSVVDRQRLEIMGHYLDSSGMLTYSTDGSVDDSSDRDIGCDQAQCVIITCTVEGPLDSGSGIAVTIDALLWQRTLIDNEMGIVDLVSMATYRLQDTSRPHTQPADGVPDTIQLKTTISTEEFPEKPVEAWIIALSTIGGILGLVILVAALWKIGFFKRKMMEDTAPLTAS